MNKENKKIALISEDREIIDSIRKAVGELFDINVFSNGIIFYNQLSSSPEGYCMILSDSSLMGVHGITLKNTIEKLGFGDLPFFMIVDKATPEDIVFAISSGVTDFIIKPIRAKQLKARLEFQLKHPTTKKKAQEYTTLKESKTPFVKRVFDIVVSGVIILILLPLFLIVAILIKLESRGPVFYYSYRVGTGYNIFKFYKFRSMDPDADAKLQQLKHLNQYNNEENVVEGEEEKPKELVNEVKELCELCEQAGGGCLQPMYDDNKMVCEKILIAKKDSNKDAAFIKIKDDPRVTKIGKFIRNTSIDELPQLWNVLRGDMSLVGNRPLPLYEAEKITTDKYALRFLGPAGITGLWQVEKRGRGEMSEEERLSLDNDYVKNFSIWFDIKILLRTIPALFQSENV